MPLWLGMQVPLYVVQCLQLNGTENLERIVTATYLCKFHIKKNTRIAKVMWLFHQLIIFQLGITYERAD
jgi:hypothetical protein